MSPKSWIRKLFARTPGTVRTAHTPRVRPSIELLEDRLTPAYSAFISMTGAANPLNGLSFGSNTAPAFGDLDGDGDLDVVVGTGGGTLSYSRNVGTATTPIYQFQTGAAHPFSSFPTGPRSVPTLGDVDGDGDLDLA